MALSSTGRNERAGRARSRHAHDGVRVGVGRLAHGALLLVVGAAALARQLVHAQRVVDVVRIRADGVPVGHGRRHEQAVVRAVTRAGRARPGQHAVQAEVGEAPVAGRGGGRRRGGRLRRDHAGRGHLAEQVVVAGDGGVRAGRGRRRRRGERAGRGEARARTRQDGGARQRGEAHAGARQAEIGGRGGAAVVVVLVAGVRVAARVLLVLVLRVRRARLAHAPRAPQVVLRVVRFVSAVHVPDALLLPPVGRNEREKQNETRYSPTFDSALGKQLKTTTNDIIQTHREMDYNRVFQWRRYARRNADESNPLHRDNHPVQLFKNRAN